MIKLNLLATAATAALIAAWPLGVLAQTATDAHHPAGGAGAQAPPQMPAGMKGGMGGDKEMMANSPMMKMMSMRKAMHGGDAAGMAMIDHVEGRIAYLRAELRITDAQAGAWDAFAAALRANAKGLATAREPITGQMGTGQMGMGQMGKGQPGMGQPGAAAGEAKAPVPVETLAQRLDAQERWQTAQLDGTRAIKSAFTKLNDVLSPDQKKAADELLPPNMGLAMPMMKM